MALAAAACFSIPKLMSEMMAMKKKGRPTIAQVRSKLLELNQDKAKEPAINAAFDAAIKSGLADERDLAGMVFEKLKAPTACPELGPLASMLKKGAS